MKKMLFLLAAMTLFIACSKDDEDNNQLFSEEKIEHNLKTFEDAVSFLEKNSSINLEYAADFVKAMDGVANVSVEDSMIQVTTQGGISFTLDFNSYPEYEEEEIDINRIKHCIDSLDNTIGQDVAKGYEKTSEVFKDYIAKISTPDNNPDVISVATRAATKNKVLLSRRNVAIWNPWKEFAGDTELVANVTNYVNKEHPLKKFKSFTPSSFQFFKDFDVIFLTTHGLPNGDVVIPFTQDLLNKYYTEVGRVQLYWVKNKGKKQYKGLILTEAFFDKYLPDLSNTIIYTSACYLGVNNSTFLNSCKKKNVADYFASDSDCSGKDIMHYFEEFYIYLMYGYSTNDAFVNGKGSFIGSFIHDGKLCTYKYSRYGSKLVYYPMPHATGVGKRNNTSNARTRSSEDNNSAIIVNAQIRYPSEESDNILKSIDAGICLQDMDTKEVTLIPFSDKNIVSNEKKTYGDVTVSNIAVSLEKLIEGHQYAYCCYTRINGIVTLSDECYMILMFANYQLRLNYSYHAKQHWTYSWRDSEDGLEDDGNNSEVLSFVNGNYYIFGSFVTGGVHQLPTDNSIVNYTYSQTEYVGDTRNCTVQCTLDSDHLHLKITEEEEEDGSYELFRWHIGYEIDIVKLDSEPLLLWTGDNSNKMEWVEKWGWTTCIWTSTYTYLGYEKRELSEDECNHIISDWCKLVSNTNKDD